MQTCDCDSNQSFATCCKPLLTGARTAATPEELMRSRYSAYCRKDIDYVARTTDPQVHFDRPAAEDWANNSQFTELKVISTSGSGNKGQVEFCAKFKTTDGTLHTHHEISKFRQMAGVWYFRDGRIIAPPDIPASSPNVG